METIPDIAAQILHCRWSKTFDFVKETMIQCVLSIRN